MKYVCGICGDKINKEYSCPKCLAAAGEQQMNKQQIVYANGYMDGLMAAENNSALCERITELKETVKSIDSPKLSKGWVLEQLVNILKKTKYQ